MYIAERNHQAESGKWDLAIENFEKSIEIAKKGGMQIELGEAYHEYGRMMARKGETKVVGNSDSGKIGVVGESLSDVQKSFKDLAEIIEAELNINIQEKVRFYWLIIHLRIKTGKNPSQEIIKFKDNDIIHGFSKILDEEISNFTIRINQKGKTPNQEDWFDIAIEPDFTKKEGEKEFALDFADSNSK